MDQQVTVALEVLHPTFSAFNYDIQGVYILLASDDQRILCRAVDE